MFSHEAVQDLLTLLLVLVLAFGAARAVWHVARDR